MKRYGVVLGWLLVVGTVAWADGIGRTVRIPEGPDWPDHGAIDLTHGHKEPEFGSPEWFEGWRQQEHTPRASSPLNSVPSHPTALGRLSALVQVGGFPPSSLAVVGLLPDARFGASLHFVGQLSPGGIGRASPNTQADTSGEEYANVVGLPGSDLSGGPGATGTVQAEMGVTVLQSKSG